MSITRGTVGGGTKSPRRFSKLACIVALATLMLGVGAVPSQATSINFTFDDTNLEHDFIFPQSELYSILFRLSFQDAVGSFGLTVTDEVVEAGLTIPGAEWAGFKCVGMSNSDCVRFTVSGPGGPEDPDVPDPITNFNGPVTVAINYLISGWPQNGDPVDIGLTDNFSSFMIFANEFLNPSPPPIAAHEFRMVHFPADGGPPTNISVGHCEHENVDLCIAQVPEPATVGGVIWGLLGLTVLGRRLKRRD